MIRPSVLAATPSSTVALAHEGAPRMLVVDDEETIRLALAKYLRSRGYHVSTAESGIEALAALSQGGYQLMLCDVRMPGMSGVELVRQATAKDSDLAVMMLTAVNDAPTATEALANGAMDYLMKPIELPDLLAACERALHKRATRIEQRRVERLIRYEVASRTSELEQEKERLRDLIVSIAETLINAMEAKDIYLRGHDRSHTAGRPAARRRQDRDSRGDTEQAREADPRGVRAREGPCADRHGDPGPPQAPRPRPRLRPRPPRARRWRRVSARPQWRGNFHRRPRPRRLRCLRRPYLQARLPRPDDPA
jgi:DNA-binding response OmpR family regulator